MKALEYFGRKGVQSLITLVGVVTAIFFIMRCLPGDPIDLMLGDYALSVEKETLRHALGFDRPLYQQFLTYLSGLARGDLGQSLHFKKPVIELILHHLSATVLLAAASMAIAVLLGIPLGIVAALKRGGWVDRLLMSVSILGISVPHFWLGPLLIIAFSVGLGWFPISGKEGFASLVLPAFTLGTAMMSLLSRMARSSLVEVMGKEYLVTARAKGLPEWAVIAKHALRNALTPVVTIAGLQIGALLSGSIVTETIFDWPGMGLLLYRAILLRDYALIEGCILLIAGVYILINLVVDMLYLLINPRLRKA